MVVMLDLMFTEDTGSSLLLLHGIFHTPFPMQGAVLVLPPEDMRVFQLHKCELVGFQHHIRYRQDLPDLLQDVQVGPQKLHCRRRQPALWAEAVVEPCFRIDDVLHTDRLLITRQEPVQQFLCGGPEPFRQPFPCKPFDAARSLPVLPSPCHQLWDFPVPCGTFVQVDAVAVFPDNGAPDIGTPRVAAVYQPLGFLRRRLVTEPDGERDPGNHLSLPVFEHPADFAAARGRHERVPVPVQYKNITHKLLPFCGKPAPWGSKVSIA